MFKGLSEGWPARELHSALHPSGRRAIERLRARQPGLSRLHEPRLQRRAKSICLVWLEVLRDKQCEDRPCEIGVPRPGAASQGRLPGQDPHPGDAGTCWARAGSSEALELIESCNPLPNVTGRVCPQELQCQGVCTLTGRPIEIGQLEWFLPRAREAGEPAGAGRAAEERRRVRGRAPKSRRSRWSAPAPPA